MFFTFTAAFVSVAAMSILLGNKDAPRERDAQ